jgi:hypothetical protein
MEERSLSGACSSLELSSAPHHLNYEVQYPYGEPAISGRIYPCRGMVLTVLYLTVPVDKEGRRGAQQHLRCAEINVILLLVAPAFGCCSTRREGSV